MTEKEEKKFTRRTFMKNSGITVGGILLGWGVSELFGDDQKKGTSTETVDLSHTHASGAHASEALLVFTLEQYRVVEAAVERIFPEDELGPGAKSLGVAVYIDHQLNTPWGNSSRDYMVGPFKQGTATQGYQGRQTNAQIFMMGLDALQKYTEKNYGDKFYILSAEQQDAILVDFENASGENKVQIDGISSSQFFQMLHSLTMEGLYSDPVYGGNKDMGGWKLKNYPGHQMTYVNIIEKEEFVVMEPTSLSSMK
ncbi:gluconate 2-dehydrogenase subunit 3 family protein [Ureibacillus sinduriensis]|uniref:Dehydrogenase n=1 Tax=Ureibacillus sinduriensis BLB-1 = JCM 15800 TaxID=1384057 RepID=A0A0A3IXA1_9BACL|nr:gluconate 2-dehydrogenase subunit 3 family protein [Ureibacillus sinduriensis]KGR79452.1 hypothetical protein CD33_00465 [Ureibacillus sinduriensis BLB-1 = JCM 15800]